MDTQVRLTPAFSWAELARVYRLVSHIVNEFVRFERVGLSEAHSALVAFVGFLSGMGTEVAFQLERVRGRVRAMRALVGSLAGMTAHVAAQLGQLDGGVVAVRALVRLLVSVLVANVTDQLAGGGEGALAELASVRFDTVVHVQMVLQRGLRLEPALAHTAPVRSVLGVRLQVAKEEVTAMAVVTAECAIERHSSSDNAAAASLLLWRGGSLVV